MRGVVLPSLGSLIFFILAPGTFAGYVPWRISRWQLGAPLLGWAGGAAGGALVIVALAALVDCFARFALQGRGTPAPIFPPERFVASGLYRHVRNPMYVAVVSLIVGQGMVFGSRTLLEYATVVWAGFHAFVLLYEEPTLSRRFGRSYEAYRDGVSRWWPRLSAWKGPAA